MYFFIILQFFHKAIDSSRRGNNNADQDACDVESLCSESSMSTSASTSRAMQPSLTDCISNIKACEDGGKKAPKLNNALVYMVVKDDMPLNTVEKEGFKYYSKVATPFFKTPCSTSLTSMLDDKYEALSGIFKRSIEKVPALSLTTDVWTDTLNTKSFIGLTGHFIDPISKKLRAVTFGVQELNERHTSDYLAEVMSVMCREWLIDMEKVIAVITDNGANIVKAIADLFGKHNHLPCFAHTLNLVASKPFHDTEGVLEAKKIVTTIKSL